MHQLTVHTSLHSAFRYPCIKICCRDPFSAPWRLKNVSIQNFLLARYMSRLFLYLCDKNNVPDTNFQIFQASFGICEGNSFVRIHFSMISQVIWSLELALFCMDTFGRAPGLRNIIYFIWILFLPPAVSGTSFIFSGYS